MTRAAKSRETKQPLKAQSSRHFLRSNKFYLSASLAITAIFLYIGVMLWKHWDVVVLMTKMILHITGIQNSSGSYLPVYQKQ